MRRATLAIAAAAGLASCQSFQSRHVDLGANSIPVGMHYAIPKALMTIELQQDSNNLWLGVSRPFLIGDPEATYSLTATSGLFADQRYKVRVDPQTRLLDYISSVSEGQATRILSNLGQSFGAIGALPRNLDENTANASSNRVQVFSQVFDPMQADTCGFGDKCELTELADLLHRKAREFLKCNAATPESPTAVKCAELGAANLRGRNEFGEDQRYFSISLDPIFKIERKPASGRGAEAASCANSICYRAPAPYLLRVRVEGQRDVSEIVMLPNKAPIMSLDLPGGVFATSRSRVDLVYGMPARLEVDQGNELVGVTAIPLTVINSFFRAVGEVFQLRINYDSKYTQVLESDLNRQRAQDRYDEEQRRRNAERDGSMADATLAPADTSDADFGDPGFGDEPETTASYLDPEGGNEDSFSAEQRRAVTIVSDPSPLLFLVPLQAERKFLPPEDLDFGTDTPDGDSDDDGDEPG